jgi:hypothetical protein
MPDLPPPEKATRLKAGMLQSQQPLGKAMQHLRLSERLIEEGMR